MNCIKFSRPLGASTFLFLAMTLITVQGHAQLRSIAVDEINPDRSTLDNSDPNGASGGRVNHLAISASDGSMFAASEWGGLFRSTDDGDTWEHLPGHVPAATWDVAVDPGDSRRVYATSFYDGKLASLSGINVSFDGGNSWFHPPTATPLAGSCLNAARRDEPSAFGIAIDPDNTDSVYVGTNCGLAISDNRGLTWRFVDPTPADNADDVWDVVVHDGGIIDLVGDDGHQRFDPSTGNWTSSGVLPTGLGSIAVSPDEQDVLFATIGTLIRQSTDGGTTWTAMTNPANQGRIPFVKTNKRSGQNFDLWFGDVSLNRARCTTPTAGGTAVRCPANSWVVTANRALGAHADMGDVLFDPGTTSNACPVAMSSDGGVYINTTTTSPGCHSPAWEQPTITPHALWLWDLSGTSYQGALNDVVIGRKSGVNMRYEIRDDANAGFPQLMSGGSGWGSGGYTTAVATGDVDGDGLSEYIIGRRSGVNMRYEILNDANAGFSQMMSGGSGWGSGGYTTAVAAGDLDGDGLDEVVIGRRSGVNMRYEILDDARTGFAQIHSGGTGWGSGGYTTSVATGDVDGDGLDEVIIGRHSSVNMRYEILDDANAGFVQMHSGGAGWGSGGYTTAVAAGDVDDDGVDEVVVGRRSGVNMRYEILDDATAGFVQIHTGGTGWGSGGYTTAVATGNVDRDPAAEVIIGRRSGVNMRYEILDDRNNGFVQLMSGGSGWGSGGYTRAVASGDLDNDGLDEVVIGRESSVNMRYEILDDQVAGFSQIFSGGSGWGSGGFTTAVAVGPVSGDRLDLYFGNQDTGTFASTNAEVPVPTWLNVDCCDGFEVPSSQSQMLVTVCCFSGQTLLFLRQPGMVNSTQVTPPTGSLRGFRPTDDVAMFGASGGAAITTGGVFVTNNLSATPTWTQLGAASSPFGARHITPVGSGSGATFFVQATQGDLRSFDTLWRYTGTSSTGTWQQIQPPGGAGGIGMYAVDSQNAQRIVISHLQAGQPPAMMITTDAGGTWNPMPALDVQLNWGGAFRAQTQRGPTRFTNFNGYPQPTLFVFSPNDPNLMIAGGIDSGVFISVDGGANWSVASDPFTPYASGTPHIPRPQFAHFDHLSSRSGLNHVDVYVGTRGRGVFRIRLGYIPVRVAPGGAAGGFAECFGRDPRICAAPEMDVGRLVLDCRRADPDCIFLDELPRNCQVKFDCPGCEGVALCPPWYRIYLDGLDPRVWEVGLMTDSGRSVQHTSHRTDTGVMLELHPPKGDFVEDSIADYLIGLRRKYDDGKGVYEIKTRLERADGPYQPESSRPEDHEGTGETDPSDDTTGLKKYPMQPEYPGEADPDDDPDGKRKHKTVPEKPGEPDPNDDTSGTRVHPPQPETGVQSD